MIILPDLSAAEMAALVADLRYGPYLMQPVVKMLDLDHRELDDLSGRFLDGQVDVNPAGTTMTVTIVDPRRQIALDGSSPATGAIFYDKMLAASVRIKGPRIGRWVTIPAFCGPVTSGSRSGPTAVINCGSKQSLALGAIWKSTVYKAGARKAAVITDLLVNAGEAPSRIKVPGLPATLPKDLAIPAIDPAYPYVADLVRSTGRQGFYDVRGDFRVRDFPRDPTLLFADGEGGNVLAEPEVTYDAYEGFNGVQVIGAATAGKRVSYTAWLPAGHPLSPEARKRGGVPYRRPYQIKNNSIRSVAEAKHVALEYLFRFGRETVKATVEVMPNWLLEPDDVVTIDTRLTGRLDQAIDTFSLPLAPGGSMTLGANRVIKRPRPGRTSQPRQRPSIGFSPAPPELGSRRSKGFSSAPAGLH